MRFTHCRVGIIITPVKSLASEIIEVDSNTGINATLQQCSKALKKLTSPYLKS